VSGAPGEGSGETFAVIVNWNGGDDNASCVASILEQGICQGHIVVVDNASVDGSLERLLDRYPNLCAIANATNEGYGNAVNKGLRRALSGGARRVLLVNNDLTLSRGALELLEGELDANAAAGIVGPRIVYRDAPDRIWSAGGMVTWRQNLSKLVGHREPDGERFLGTRTVDYVAGAALLARREVFETVGLLDGDYFAYHEDLEFCLRAGEAGFGVRCVGSALAVHAAHTATGGGYNPRRKYMMAVNTVRFLKQRGTPLRWLSFFVFDVASLPLVWLWRAPRGEGAAVCAKARGTWDGLRGRRVDAESVRALGPP